MAYPLSLGKYKLEIDAYGFVLKNPIALAVGVSIIVLVLGIGFITTNISNKEAEADHEYKDWKKTNDRC